MVQRFVGFALLAFAAVAPSAYAIEVNVSGNSVSVSDSGSQANMVSITRTGDTITVRDTAVPPTESNAACMTSPDDPSAVVCTVPNAILASVYLGGGANTLTMAGIGSDYVYGGDEVDEITGSEFRDVILGGGGNDRIDGGDGPDQIDGGAGDDELEGGAGNDFFWNNSGADVFKDTPGGSDSVSYVTNTADAAGVEITLDGVANDGNLNEDGGRDNVAAGIEHVQGSNFADEIQGGPGADSLSGAAGNDTLVGNGGADSFNGAEGDDRIDARDGVADADIDCDNSMGTLGTADVAILDASDPQPRNCETVDRAAGGGGSTGTGGTGTGAGTGGTGTGAGTGTGGTGTGGGRGGTGTTAPEVIATDETTERSRMPNVVGKEIDRARQAVLAKVLGVDLDVVFQKGCGEKKDLEVLRQRPAAGSWLTTYEGSDVPIRLYVCVAQRTFLAQCTLDGLRSDLKELPKRQDAEVALAITRKFAKCKVDYDIKLAKQAEEAKVALAAQRAAEAKNKRRADLRVGLSCPVKPAEQDLRMPITQGYMPDPTSQLGLHAIDESAAGLGFTLPVTQAPYNSYVDMRAYHRNLGPVEATVYIDAEGVGIEQGGFGGTPRSVKLKDGYARVKFVPRRPGKIKLCAVLETGDDKVLTYAVEIRVVAVKVGDVWPTVGGRRLQKTRDGWKDISDQPVARAAGLAEAWEWLKSLFAGTSRTVNQADREQTVGPAKARKAGSKVSLGQVTLDGTLDSNPVPPAIEMGTCGAQAEGLLKLIKCPVVVTKDGSALVGMSTTGEKTLALGAAGVVNYDGAKVVKNGEAKLIGADGGSLIGADGGSLIGADGGSLIGADGGSLIGADGGSAIGPAPNGLIGADGGTLVGADGASLIGADGGT